MECLSCPGLSVVLRYLTCDKNSKEQLGFSLRPHGICVIGPALLDSRNAEGETFWVLGQATPPVQSVTWKKKITSVLLVEIKFSFLQNLNLSGGPWRCLTASKSLFLPLSVKSHLQDGSEAKWSPHSDPLCLHLGCRKHGLHCLCLPSSPWLRTPGSCRRKPFSLCGVLTTQELQQIQPALV